MKNSDTVCDDGMTYFIDHGYFITPKIPMNKAWRIPLANYDCLKLRMNRFIVHFSEMFRSHLSTRELDVEYDYRFLRIQTKNAYLRFQCASPLCQSKLSKSPDRLIDILSHTRLVFLFRVMLVCIN